MRKSILVFVVVLLLSSCNNKEVIQVNILNDTIYTSYNKENSISIIKYEIINKSDEGIYINGILDSEKEDFYKKCIFKDNRLIKIYDSDNNEVDYNVIGVEISSVDIESKKIINDISISELKKLNYSNSIRYFMLNDRSINSFIFPNTKVYFEFYVRILDGKFHDERQFFYVNLKPEKEYLAKLSIVSDSTNYKKNLPWDIIKTIEANNVKVYHGILESKNRVPIRILE